MSSFLHDIRFVIAFYVIGDLLTTYYAITYGYGYEANGVLALFLSTYGFFSLLMLKLVFLLVLYVNYHLKDGYTTCWNFTRYSTTALGIILTASNLFVIRTGTALLEVI